MKILCVIPARGGSKRIPHKNIAICGGIPLIAWTIVAAQRAGMDPIVSTDSEYTARIAKDYGASTLDRPERICTDISRTEDALIHAIGDDYSYTHVLCLPPTSPLRESNVILSVLHTEQTEYTDCVMTVNEYRGDLWRKNGELLTRLDENAPRRQQDRTPLWEENSAVYLTRVSSLITTRSVLGFGNVIGVPISREDAFDINDPLDFKIADMLLTDRLARRRASSLSLGL